MSKAKIKGSGNGRFVGHSIRISREQTMRAYDKLPPPIRQVLRDNVSDSTGTGLTKLIRDHGPEPIARALRAAAIQAAHDFVAAEFGRDAIPVLCGHLPTPRQAFEGVA